MLPDFHARQRDYLLEIAQAITQELDLPRLLERILRYAVEMLDGSAGIIALHVPSPASSPPSAWRVAASYGLQPAFLRLLQPLLDGIPAHEQGSPTALAEVNHRLRELTRYASLGLLTGLALPLLAREQVVGLIFVFRDTEAIFTPNERALLQSFADQAAIAVANARLFSQVLEEKHRLDAILDASADGIALLGPDNHVQRFNRALQRLTGYTLEEAQGRDQREIFRFHQITSGTSLEQAEAGGWPLSDEAALYVEGALLRHDGRTLPVGVSYAPLFSAEHALLNTIVGVRDLTRFREADEMKSTFISVVSHELKTPVALIKGYASTLRREDAHWDPATVQDGLAVIEEEADRLTALVEDLLDASRLQAGGLQLHMGEVQLRPLAERLAARFATQPPPHTIKVAFPETFPPIVADEERLAQVLSNLLSNAIKYSPEGTTVDMRGRVEPDAVVLTVADQGAGIPSADLPHVFDRFYRAPDAARHTKGAGLGLYLARAVVEAHGGRIWADARPEGGTSVSLSLPRSPGPT